MGRVYEAYDETRGHMVAVKVMSPKWANDEKARARFLREVEATKRIRHPNVVEVYGAGFCDEEENRPYLAMERLYGTSLWHYVHCPIQGHGPVAIEMAVDLMEQAAEALEATHEAGVIHRDVKPENFLLTRGPDDEPVIKLLDFGLVQVAFGEGPKLTEEGTFVGTPEYMAPELAFGHPASPRTDVYGLASAFYELVTGKMAFSGKTHFEIISKKQKNRAPSLSEGNAAIEFRPAMEEVIARALSRSPEKRQTNPAELTRELRATLHGEVPVEAEPAAVTLPRDTSESGPRRRAPSLPPESDAPIRAAGDRRPRRVALAVAVIVAIFGGLGYAAYTGRFDPADEGVESEQSSRTDAERSAALAAAGADEPEPLIDLDVGSEAGVAGVDDGEQVETVPATLAAGSEVAEEQGEDEAPLAAAAAAPAPRAVAPRRVRSPEPDPSPATQRAAAPSLDALADRAGAVADSAPTDPAGEPPAAADVAQNTAPEPAPPAAAPETETEPAAETPDVSAAVGDAVREIGQIDLERSLL